jgi:hypothetical protein
LTFKGIKTSRKKRRTGYALFRKGEYTWNGPVRRSLKLPELPRKKWAGIALAVFLIFILAIGNYGPFGPIGFVQGDYNTSFSHTRTNIFTDTQMLGPSTTGGTPTFVSKSGSSCIIGTGGTTLPTINGISKGDNIIVTIWGIGVFNSFVVSDTQGFTYTEKVFVLTGSGAGSSSYIYTSSPSTSSGLVSDTVTVATGGANRQFCVEASDYTNTQGGFGVTGTNLNDAAGATSGTSTLSFTVSSGSVVIEAMTTNDGSTGLTFTAASGQTIRHQNSASGPQFVFTDKSGLSGFVTLSISYSGATSVSSYSQVALELKSSSAVTDFSKVRWNFNSTCVALGGPLTPQMTFDYSLGTTGSGGKNCNSADIAITKSSFNLQTISGRQMEMVMAWNHLINSPIKNVTLVLRVNGTLPSFTTSYNPFTDVAARLIWNACPIPVCSGGTQSVYVVHDNTKTLSQETPGNDLIITGPDANFNNANANQNTFQSVLNFTGPLNYLQSNSVTNSTNSASNLQFGEDYFILVIAQFDTSQSPGNFSASFAGGQNPPNGIGDPSFGIWSVPSACTDPVNKTACSLPTAQPVFNFNPLDPSSWGNAIIKGLLWVFTVAVPQGLSIIVSVVLAVLQAVLNQIGQFIGWGNIGDQFFSFAAGVITYFTTGLGDALGWLLRLILRAIDLIKIANFWVNFYLGGLLNFLADLLNVIAEFVVFGTKIVTFLGSSYVLIMILFFLWYDGDEGLEGWYNWFETTKWFAFISFDFLERMINFGISSITWLFGRIPTLDGTTLPELPTIAIGGGPHFPTFEMRALKEGNFAALF